MKGRDFLIAAVRAQPGPAGHGQVASFPSHLAAAPLSSRAQPCPREPTPAKSPACGRTAAPARRTAAQQHPNQRPLPSVASPKPTGTGSGSSLIAVASIAAVAVSIWAVTLTAHRIRLAK